MQTREQRIKERLFGEIETFDRSTGFTALPIILRRGQFLFGSPRHWQVYTYIMMRTGPGGVAWFPLSDMAWDLNFQSLPKLRPYIDDLSRDGWIKHELSKGRDYYLVPDPLSVILNFYRTEKIPPDRAEAIDELLEALSQETLENRAAAQKTVSKEPKSE